MTAKRTMIVAGVVVLLLAVLTAWRVARPVDDLEADETARRSQPEGTTIEESGATTDAINDSTEELAPDPAAAGVVELRIQTTTFRGLPIAHARVRVVTWHRDIDSTLETDDDGFAAFRLPAGITVGVIAEADGFGRLTTGGDVELPTEGRLDHVIRLPHGRTITGTVRDAETNAPIADAVIGMNWSQTRAVRSGDEGRYELPGWTSVEFSGIRDIVVTATGYGRESIVVGAREVVDVVMMRGDAVIGRILGPDGAPIVDARVVAEGRSRATGVARSSRGTGVSDVEGRFRVSDLRHDLVHTLTIEAAGFGRTLIDVEPRGEPGTIDVGDVRLSEGRAIAGTVIGDGGEPIADVEVSLSADGRGYQFRRTDEEGGYRFDDLAAGIYDLTVHSDDRPNGGRRVELGDVDVLDAVIRLSAGRRVTITVVDGDGRPIENVWIGAPFGGDVWAQTDAAGRCVLSVEAAEPVVVVADVDELDEDYIEPPEQTLSSDATEMTFRLPRAKPIRARVVGADGAPLGRGVFVEIRGPGEPVFTTTNVEGRIAHLVAAPEPVDLIVRGRAWRDVGTGRSLLEHHRFAGEARGVKPGGEEATIRLRAVAFDRTLTVRVLGIDGEPRERMRVRMSGLGAPRASGLTDATGTVVLRELPPDLCSFVVESTESLEEDALLPARLEVEPAGQTITMPLRRAVEVTGTLRDDAEELVAGADVEARFGMFGDDDLFRGKTDDAGRFTIRVPADAPPFLLVATWVAADGTRASAALDGARPGTDVRLAER